MLIFLLRGNKKIHKIKKWLELVPVIFPLFSGRRSRRSGRVDVDLRPETVRQLVVDRLGHVVVAPVHQIRPEIEVQKFKISQI